MRELPGSVLFCCTQNALRSPMAEAMMKHLHGRRVFVDSVGVRTGPLDDFAVAVMDDIGIDITRHKPKSFDDLEDDSFDLIISLSPEAQHKAVDMTRALAAEVEFWNTFDPSVVEGSREARLEAYRQVRDQLMHRLLQRFPPSGAPGVLVESGPGIEVFEGFVGAGSREYDPRPRGSPSSTKNGSGSAQAMEIGCPRKI